VGPRVNLDAVKKRRKNLSLPGTEPGPPQPVGRIYRLNCPLVLMLNIMKFHDSNPSRKRGYLVQSFSDISHAMKILRWGLQMPVIRQCSLSHSFQHLILNHLHNYR
jgi:hypothetical protein